MSEIISKAEEVAESIVQSNEFEKLQLSEKKLEEDETASRIMEEFENKKQQMNRIAQSGQGNMQQIRREIRELQSKMWENQIINEYMQAQQSFNRVMQQVNGEISSALGIQQQGGCAPGCGSC